MDSTVLVLLVIHFFFIHNGQRPPTLKDFHPRFKRLLIYPVLICEKEAVFPFKWLNKGTIGAIFITSLVFCGPWLGIELGPPALEASTIPLGYRGSSLVYYFLIFSPFFSPFSIFFFFLFSWFKTSKTIAVVFFLWCSQNNTCSSGTNNAGV